MGLRHDITGNLVDDFGKIGAYAEVKHTFEQEDVNLFGELCGDNNPIHVDPTFAANSMFNGTIVHGIFVSSLFSTLFGRTIAGSIYVSQNLIFRSPVHVGKALVGRVEIIEVNEKSKGLLITCSTRCVLHDGTLAVDGTARVLVPTIIAEELKKLSSTLTPSENVGK